ncbi:MAG: MBL fold metallo-hydrolase [Clostridiaceae bacterium]|nr:MBL fold metallo-hydrolase [Clostridiaceae bacterium]
MKLIQLHVGVVQTNCYVFYDENTMEGAVIDPGDNAAAILREIDRAGAKITYILLTHGHFDHILAVHEIAEKTGAKLVIHKEDEWLLSYDEMGEFRPYARHYVPTPVDILAEEGTTIQVGGLTAEYLHTPGHTPGSCCIKVEDVLFTGDTMFRHECGRCDLKGGDFSLMLQSLKRLHDLPGDYRVLPGHDSITTLSEERARNPYVRQALGK